jgi:hypothetical protein
MLNHANVEHVDETAFISISTLCVRGCHVKSRVDWIVTPFHGAHGFSNAQYFRSSVLLLSGQTFFLNDDSHSGNVVLHSSLTFLIMCGQG